MEPVTLAMPSQTWQKDSRASLEERVVLQYHTYTHTRLTALFPGLPGEPAPER